MENLCQRTNKGDVEEITKLCQYHGEPSTLGLSYFEVKVAQRHKFRSVWKDTPLMSLKDGNPF